MKRLFLAVLIMTAVMLTACSGAAAEEEVFGARAAYAISRHIGGDAETSPKTFTINYIEYKVEDDFPCALVEVILPYPDNVYERNVYMLSTGGDYYVGYLNQGKAVFDEPTQLYVVNEGDAVINKQDECRVNVKNVLKIFNKLVKTNDLALIGLGDTE